MDKRRLFSYLYAEQGEKRVMPAGFEVYDLLDRATQDVLREINQAQRAQARIKPRMSSINLELDQALTQTSLFGAQEYIPDEDLRAKVQQVLQNVQLDLFKRDKTLKAIRQRYKETQNQQELIDALDAFFVDNDLYREIPVQRTTLEQIHAEDLKLIAYEVFG